MLGPYIVVINDTILTLLLCLYLLSARTARGEYDRNRATHLAGKLTVMEKIELMNRNYVSLLVTFLSSSDQLFIRIRCYWTADQP